MQFAAGQIHGRRSCEGLGIYSLFSHGTAVSVGALFQVGHLRGAVMGAAAYVGRVGGLAVALGVGAAVATGQGVASASPTESTSSTSESSASASSEESSVRAPRRIRIPRTTHRSLRFRLSEVLDADIARRIEIGRHPHRRTRQGFEHGWSL